MTTRCWLELTHLEALEVSYLYNGQSIGDVSWISGLGRLRELSLVYLDLTSLDFVLELGTLEYLSVSDNQLTDLSAISGLQQLNSLYLWNNQISDVSPLTKPCQILVS